MRLTFVCIAFSVGRAAHRFRNIRVLHPSHLGHVVYADDGRRDGDAGAQQKRVRSQTLVLIDAIWTAKCVGG